MPKRRNKAQDIAVGSLVVVGLTIWIISRLAATVGIAALVVMFIVAVIAIVLYKRSQHNRRIEYLTNKHADALVVQKILAKELWEGQTAEQLADSIGHPAGVDTKHMATRKREIWKYKPTGKNRYGLRITLDDDVVTGWDQKV